MKNRVQICYPYNASPLRNDLRLVFGSLTSEEVSYSFSIEHLLSSMWLHLTVPRPSDFRLAAPILSSKSERFRTNRKPPPVKLFHHPNLEIQKPFDGVTPGSYKEGAGVLVICNSQEKRF